MISLNSVQSAPSFFIGLIFPWKLEHKFYAKFPSFYKLFSMFLGSFAWESDMNINSCTFHVRLLNLFQLVTHLHTIRESVRMSELVKAQFIIEKRTGILPQHLQSQISLHNIFIEKTIEEKRRKWILRNSSKTNLHKFLHTYT